MKKLIFMSISVSLLFGCQSEDIFIDSSLSDSPIMFHKAPPANGEYVFHEALMIGKLVIVDNCVQIENNSELITPVWPDYARLVQSGSKYKIKLKNKTLSFGKTYHFGGAGSDGRPIAEKYKICPANLFWGVGEVAK